MPLELAAVWMANNSYPYIYGNGWHDSGTGLWAYASYVE
jgi:hypothetical protein